MTAKKNYIYVKREDIKDLHAVVEGELQQIDSKRILSGSYVSTKKTTPTVKGVATLRKRILDFAKSVAKDEVKEYEKYVKNADLKALSDAGLTDEMIVAFYCGVRSVIDFNSHAVRQEIAGKVKEQKRVSKVLMTVMIRNIMALGLSSQNLTLM